MGRKSQKCFKSAPFPFSFTPTEYLHLKTKILEMLTELEMNN